MLLIVALCFFKDAGVLATGEQPPLLLLSNRPALFHRRIKNAAILAT
jgi:hypothetical protein